MENNTEFSFTYSAEEQDEIKRIREKYTPRKPEDDKMERLRRLDAHPTRVASIISIILGILGALTLGVGMCCTMVWAGVWFIPGIFIGVFGIAVLLLAYPIYNLILKREREKVAPEIISLSDELIK